MALKFLTTREMVENIKDILCRQKTIKGRKVFDADVAGVLRLAPTQLTTRVYRDRPPLAEILMFCARCGVDVKDIIFKDDS